MAKDQETFSGLISSVTYEDAAKAFYILKMVLDSRSQNPILSSTMVTVRGTIPVMKVAPGAWLSFEGKTIHHEKFGWQIEITKAPLLPEWTTQNVLSFLSSNGVSRLHLNTCIDALGDTFVDALDKKDPDLFVGLGLSDYVIKHMLETWQTSKSFLTTINYLIQLGVPKSAITQIWETFQDSAREVLSKNPWLLTQAEGVTFEQADMIAQLLKLDFKVAERLEGAILFCLRAFRMSGDVYADRTELWQRVNNLLDGTQYNGYTSKEYTEALKILQDSKWVVLEDSDAVYEPWLYQAEQKSAELLLERQQTALWDSEQQKLQLMKALSAIDTQVEVVAETGDFDATIQSAVEHASTVSGLTLTAMQAKGVYHALVNPVSVITGLPGTGKTSLLKSLVKILQASKITMLLVAPTGIAAKRLASVTGVPAKTVHRAFGAKGSYDEDKTTTYAGVTGNKSASVEQDSSDWEYGPNNPHPAQYVLIDETSMLDQALLHRVLFSTSDQCRLVFVGDAAQLPSVGPGNVLRELVASNVFPTISLTDIFRQEEASDIVIAAHQIHRGEVPEITSEGDFVFLPVNTEDDALKVLITLAQKAHVKGLNYQVLSPRHAGTVGVTNLNTVFRELLNPMLPGKQEVKLASGAVREDDRVMFVKNDYNLNVYNGDLGKVVRIDNRAKEIEVELTGTPVLRILVPFKKANSLLRLAYASTTHKSQGQEWEYIFMPILPIFRSQLQRNLFYTAITRAKKKVFLVGDPQSLATAIANNKEDVRHTKLAQRLQK